MRVCGSSRRAAATRCCSMFGVLMVMSAFAARLQGAEIYTNGAGGGDWSDPATWRGAVVPGPADDAVVSQSDHVVFARNDTDAVTCRNLYIDPKASFTFKPRAGAVTLTVSGVMESSGAVVLDGTRGSDDVMTLRFIGADAETRGGKIMKGGSLICTGAATGEDVEANVRIISCPPDVPENKIQTKLTVEDGAGVDLRRSRFEHIAVHINDIDNTGAEYNERVNVTGSQFVGQAMLFLSRCDSPVVADCRFERKVYIGASSALQLNNCPLAEIRNVDIRGGYYYCLHSYGNTDANVDGVTIDGGHVSVYWYGADAMIRNLTVRNSHNIGVMLNYMSGMIDGLLTDNCATPVSHSVATVQINNWQAERIKEDKPVAVYFHNGRMTLLNCDIKPELVKFHPEARPPQKDDSGDPLVRCMQFLIAGVKGAMPAGAVVEVKTTRPGAAIKPGQMDMNIRNSPAPVLSNRLTPLPGTLRSLVVASWGYGIDKKFIEAPKYTVTAFGPAGAGGKRPVLKSMSVQPTGDWFRADPDDPSATVEVVLP